LELLVERVDDVERVSCALTVADARASSRVVVS